EGWQLLALLLRWGLGLGLGLGCSVPVSLLGGGLGRWVRNLLETLDPELVVEGRDRRLQSREQPVVERLLLLDLRQHRGPLGLQEAEEPRLPLAHAVGGHLVDETLRAGVDR